MLHSHSPRTVISIEQGLII